MTSGILKFLCRDCLATVLGLILVVIVIISLAMTSIASQNWMKGLVSYSEIRHSAAQNEDLLKKKNMEIEELMRSGEMLLFKDGL